MEDSNEIIEFDYNQDLEHCCSDESKCHRSLVKDMVEDAINFLSG